MSDETRAGGPVRGRTDNYLRKENKTQDVTKPRALNPVQWARVPMPDYECEKGGWVSGTAPRHRRGSVTPRNLSNENYHRRSPLDNRSACLIELSDSSVAFDRRKRRTGMFLYSQDSSTLKRIR